VALPERVSRVIVTATAAVEHQGHKPAADHDGKDGPQSHRYPAMPAHFNVAGRIPGCHHPNSGEAEQKQQNGQKKDISSTHVFHAAAFLV